MSRFLFAFVCLLVMVLHDVVFSSVAASNEDKNDKMNDSDNDNDNDDIWIVGVPGGVQKLPASYLQTSFSRWILLGQDPETMTLQVIPTSSLSSSDDDDDDGYVNPTSTTHLWWPMDLKELQARPTLDIVLQSGIPKYACGGVDVRVPPQAAANGQEWRNHGLHSQPVARQWLPFASTSLPGFSVEAFVGEKNQNQNQQQQQQQSVEDDGAENDPTSSTTTTSNIIEWKTIGTKSQVRDALQLFGIFWSGLESSSPLSQGFHIISIPLLLGEEDWTNLPKPETNMSGRDGYVLMSLATAQGNIQDLLSNQNTLTSSILAVDVTPTAPGSESDHLPPVYQPLYGVVVVVDKKEG